MLKVILSIVVLFLLLLPINSFSLDEIGQDKKTIKKIYSISSPSSKIGTNGFADIIETLTPAVVNISTSRIRGIDQSDIDIDETLNSFSSNSIFQNFQDLLESKEDRDKEVLSLGSGFIISKDGYVVTNYHVIKDADEIKINLNDSRSFKAKIIGHDSKTDLALLKIATKEDLPYVKIGNSDKSRIGEWVIAIGNPFGLGGSVSVGIISANNRDINSGRSDNYIQTDAAINKGNSGGPLFNIKGEVIGVATAIFSPSGGNIGIGFATPSLIAKDIIKELKNKGTITRGWLGVSVQNVTKEIASAIGLDSIEGAFVIEINKKGPAQKAKILPTDIIIEFNGQKIKEMKDLPRIVSSTPVNKKVKVKIIRQGSVKIIKVKIAKLDEEYISKIAQENLILGNNKASDKILGIGLVNLTKKIKENNKIKNNAKGILITDIDKNSKAYKESIEIGDIILSANQIPIESISDLKKIIKDLKNKNRKSILLFVNREKLIKTSNFIQRQSYSFTITLPLN